MGPKPTDSKSQTKDVLMQEPLLEPEAPTDSVPVGAPELTIPASSLPSDLLLVIFIHGFVHKNDKEGLN